MIVIQYLIDIMMLKILSRFPLSLLYVLADVVAFLTFRVIRYRRAVVLQNLRNAFPEKTDLELEAIAKDFYANLSDVVVEAIKAHRFSAEEISQRVQIRGLEHIAPYRDANSSIVVLAAHQCNWEWLLLSCSALSYVNIDALYKPLHNKKIDAFMRSTRGRFGVNLISSKNAMREIIQRRNKLEAIVGIADQPPSRRAPKYWATCLNQDTAFHIGMERMAKVLKAPVFFISMKRVRRGYYVAELKKIAEPPYEKFSHAITQRYSECFENQIIASPSDWLWSNRRWKYQKQECGELEKEVQ